MKNKLAIFFLIVISACLFSENAYSCCKFSNNQYSCNIIFFALRDAGTALGRCEAGNRNECIRADRLIERADVAVIQLLTDCTRGNCLRGNLARLEEYAQSIARLSRRLNAVGIRRSYANTLDTVRSWKNTKTCVAQTIQQRCQQYADTAVRQNQLNTSKGCGYTGNKWSNNNAGHYNWCLGVSENAAHQETEARKILLDNCAVAGACNRFIASWKWFNNITVMISGDYRFSASDNTNGTWRCLSNGNIEMRWSTGWVDTISISPDGSSISGRNQQGNNISATRIKTDCPGGYNPYGCL